MNRYIVLIFLTFSFYKPTQIHAIGACESVVLQVKNEILVQRLKPNLKLRHVDDKVLLLEAWKVFIQNRNELGAEPPSTARYSIIKEEQKDLLELFFYAYRKLVFSKHFNSLPGFDFLDRDDLVQISYEALLKSSEKFELRPDSSNNFKNYYVRALRSAIINSISSAMGILSSTYDSVIKTKSKSKKFLQINGRLPTDEELKNQLGFSQNKLTSLSGPLINFNYRPQYVDNYSRPDETDHLTYFQVEALLTILKQKISEKDFEILHSRYIEGKTLQQIASERHTSFGAIRTILKNALDHARQLNIEQYFDE